MYWIFIVIFIITVLIPDIIRRDVFFLSETRAEEIAIFLMGAIAFVAFIKNERLLIFHKREKAKDQKKINQTVKDLMESYSYIGEVNRKMDILMNIALGLSDRSLLSKSKENEIYKSILSATDFIFKAESTYIRFVDLNTFQTKKELKTKENGLNIKNDELADMEEDAQIKKLNDCIIIRSSQSIKNIKSYIIIRNYDKEEENSAKNIEIVKVFASQALFLYSYTHGEIIK